MNLIKKTFALSLSLSLAFPLQAFAKEPRSAQVSSDSWKGVQLNNEAPPIFYSDRPALLLQLDGPVVWNPIAQTDLKFAVNTNWDLFQESSGALYLLNQDMWLTANRIEGPWRAADSLPASLQRLPEDENWKEVRRQLKIKRFRAEEIPTVFVSQVPAELIVVEGEPQLEAISGTQLAWVRNSDDALFFNQGDQNYYYLASGRWFRSPQIQNGRWSFASEDLPQDFRNFPRSHPQAGIRVSVPGTPEAEEAVRQASIPQKTKIQRNTQVEIDYAGDPQFENIPDTRLQYAVNTSSQVIAANRSYYLVQDGAWFVAQDPRGPWLAADYVPDEIYSIPPRSPVYNVTYVRIYNYNDREIEYGHTAGYWGSFVLGTAFGVALTYGSGWYSDPYVNLNYEYPVYYHRPCGCDTYYVHHHDHYYGDYSRGSRRHHEGQRPYYGPRGGRGSVAVYNPRQGSYSRREPIYGATPWKKAPTNTPFSRPRMMPASKNTTNYQPQPQQQNYPSPRPTQGRDSHTRPAWEKTIASPQPQNGHWKKPAPTQARPQAFYHPQNPPMKNSPLQAGENRNGIPVKPKIQGTREKIDEKPRVREKAPTPQKIKPARETADSYPKADPVVTPSPRGEYQDKGFRRDTALPATYRGARR